MQVKAEVVESKTVNVNVNPMDILDQLEKQWLRTTKQRGEYINANGHWESWEDTGRGSGITERFEKATEHEIEVMNSFRTLKKVVRDLRNI